jgi:hypothetical protein
MKTRVIEVVDCQDCPRAVSCTVFRGYIRGFGDLKQVEECCPLPTKLDYIKANHIGRHVPKKGDTDE